MFSAKLERRRQFKRLAALAALAVFVAGIAAIVVAAMRASTLLEAADAEGATPLLLGVIVALASLLVLCLLVYVAVRIAGRAQL